jgi:hypothetical protein
VTEKRDTYAIRVQCECDKVKEVSAILICGICNNTFTRTFVPITAAIGSPDGHIKLVDEYEEYIASIHLFVLQDYTLIWSKQAFLIAVTIQQNH